jgi:hypothetical protein
MLNIFEEEEEESSVANVWPERSKCLSHSSNFLINFCKWSFFILIPGRILSHITTWTWSKIQSIYSFLDILRYEFEHFLSHDVRTSPLRWFFMRALVHPLVWYVWKNWNAFQTLYMYSTAMNPFILFWQHAHVTWFHKYGHQSSFLHHGWNSYTGYAALWTTSTSNNIQPIQNQVNTFIHNIKYCFYFPADM